MATNDLTRQRSGPNAGFLFRCYSRPESAQCNRRHFACGSIQTNPPVSRSMFSMLHSAAGRLIAAGTASRRAASTRRFASRQSTAEGTRPAKNMTAPAAIMSGVQQPPMPTPRANSPASIATPAAPLSVVDATLSKLTHAMRYGLPAAGKKIVNGFVRDFKSLFMTPIRPAVD
jgi:hypothetical protein